MPRSMNFITKVAGALMLVVVTALSGCGGEKTAPPPSAPTVSFVTVKTSRVPMTTELSGRTVPFRVAEIRPRVNGLILKRLFEEGSTVEEGQVLYRIDPAPYQAALNSAEAGLAQAKANLSSIKLRKQRMEDLLPTHAVSQQDYDDASAGLQQAEAAVASAKAQLSMARINLDYTDVTAPISGRIGRSSVTEGAVVTAYQPMALATVQQLDPIYVDMPQSTNDLMRLKRNLSNGSLHPEKSGQDVVQLIEEDGTGYPLPGTLQFRDVTVDPSTGSVTLRALFENPKTMLLPDMFVRCVVTEGMIPDAILVPQQAVARDPKGNPYVWVIDAQDKAQIQALEL
ncbi:MAG TPA: efflux RND transporter periplasmic adaptor subunit, partial [Candidatus Krumholzibacteria bacterium]|nr:efflux RND transporter periplasmic adaptor subunit [Candidatus Krumholzibacteria bacterium]